MQWYNWAFLSHSGMFDSSLIQRFSICPFFSSICIKLQSTFKKLWTYSWTMFFNEKVLPIEKINIKVSLYYKHSSEMNIIKTDRCSSLSSKLCPFTQKQCIPHGHYFINALNFSLWGLWSYLWLYLLYFLLLLLSSNIWQSILVLASL